MSVEPRMALFLEIADLELKEKNLAYEYLHLKAIGLTFDSVRFNEAYLNWRECQHLIETKRFSYVTQWREDNGVS